jgi:LPXTG-motif cell wall-anchored protein
VGTKVKRTKKFSVRKVLAGSIASITAATIFFGAHPTLAEAPTATMTLDLIPLGTYTGFGGQQASEIVAFDSASKQMYITNGALNRIDIVDVAVPATPTLVRSVDMLVYGRGVQSVTVGDGIVAAAVDVAPVVSANGRQTASNGLIVLMDTTGRVLKTVGVGNLPDHVSFTPDKKTILVASEGEPICSLNDGSTSANETVDPALVSDANGTVSLIDVSSGAANATVTNLDFSSFDKTALLAENVRVFFPGSSAAQDLEPEYITTNAAGTRAYVTLQEANAIAVVDLVNKTILDVAPLGYKDWSAAGLLYDGSKVDSGTSGVFANPISYAGVPLKGMYMPDTIASMQKGGETFLLTANEGDARDYDCYKEESTFGDVSGADSFASYWDSANDTVKADNKLGKQKTTLAFPTQTPVSGTRSNLYTFGGRSFSIWNSSGELVWDSGSQFEEITLRDYPATFNSESDKALATSLLMVQRQNLNMDGRSTSKGIEPEALAVGTIGTQTFAFIGLERAGGIMVYDVSNPTAPSFVRYKNAALEGLARTPADNTTPGSYDVSPEGMVFVPAAASPNNKPMLIVANELSGTTTMYEVRVATATSVPADAPAAATLTALAEKAITATTTGLTAGGSISATYSGFVPFETVQLVVASTPTVIATGTADAKGSVTIAGTLPAGLANGAHTLSLFAPVSGIGFKSTITLGATATTTTPPAVTTVPVTVAANTLPATGSDSDQMPFALGIIALGLALVGFKRRRVA